MTKIPKALSPGEEALALHLRAEKIPFIRELEFGERKFRFDFALMDRKIAIEVEGGIWIRGAHVRGRKFEQDCEKYNLAAKLGWTVLRYSTEMVIRGDAIADILELVRPERAQALREELIERSRYDGLKESERNLLRWNEEKAERIREQDALLDEWIRFCAEAEKPINACVSMSAIHGFPYEGPNWGDLLERTKACRREGPKTMVKVEAI